MKLNNGLKFLFFSLVIILIIISIYIIYGRDKNNLISVNNQRKNTDISYNFSIGITNYDTLNPILTNSKDCKYVSKLIYNSLLKTDKDFSIKPDIAKEWSKLGNKTYIVKLNDYFVWHDGTKLTSEDVKFTVEGIKNIKNSSYYKDIEKIDEVEIIDDYTLKIFLTEEVENFEYNMNFPILAKHCYNKETLEQTTTYLIGTGEYRIINDEQNRIILTNDKQRDIVINIYQTVTKMYNAFNKRKVDIIYTENYNYENYLGRIGYKGNNSYGQKYGYMIINTERVNKDIRQALNYGINKNNIIYDIFKNKYKICNFPIEYKKYLNIEKINVYEYNQNKAINIKNNKNVWLKLLVERDNQKLIEVAEKIKEQLEECEIIIDIIKYREEDFDYYISLNNYDLILLEENIDTNFDIRKYFIEKNYSNYNNSNILNLLNEAKNIYDSKIQQDILNEILQIYKEDLPFISLYYNCNMILHNTKLKGDFDHNWNDLFYNIDNWYKIIN